MAIEALAYLEYPEAVALHFELMLLVGETRFGVFDRKLIEFGARCLLVAQQLTYLLLIQFFWLHFD